MENVLNMYRSKDREDSEEDAAKRTKLSKRMLQLLLQ